MGFHSRESREESLRFRRFGTIKVGDVPFDIVSPKRSITGNNVIVLRAARNRAQLPAES
jgi:hypothetical protein